MLLPIVIVVVGGVGGVEPIQIAATDMEDYLDRVRRADGQLEVGAVGVRLCLARHGAVCAVILVLGWVCATATFFPDRDAGMQDARREIFPRARSEP